MPPRCPSITEFIPIRGLRYGVRHWGNPDAPLLFFLHGWMDSSATFQFVVDALATEWHIVAPDWRGYGRSEYLDRAYWFPDYYADLDALLQHYSPDCPARIVGHSMGANIASVYAGSRPHRVAQLAMLDFLGLQPVAAVDAPAQLGNWLHNLTQTPRLGSYENHAALARRLQQSNRRLSPERAEFLSREVSRVRHDQRIEMACDPWHRVPSPTLYKIEDSMACWQNIACPVLMMIAEDGYVVERFGHDSEEFRRRIACFRQVDIARIADAGHNLQHDQPEQVAMALERFLWEYLEK